MITVWAKQRMGVEEKEKWGSQDLGKSVKKKKYIYIYSISYSSIHCL